MIIALEGAPASGKTSTAEHLIRNGDGVRIPEISATFVRPDPESVVWSFQRQIDRWSLARRSDRDDGLVVLDGDPYRPVWSSWSDPDHSELPWQEVLGFFEDRQAAAGVPRFYAYLIVETEERYRRIAARAVALGRDRSRAIAKHRAYEMMLGPQKAFFAALGDAFPGFALRCDGTVPEVTARAIFAHAPPEPVQTSAVLDFMRAWLGTHSAGEFADPGLP